MTKVSTLKRTVAGAALALAMVGVLHTGAGSASAYQRGLGGLNLDAYCQAKGSEASAVRYNKWICYGPTFTIDFYDACRWTYGAYAYPQAEPGRPLAINCFRNEKLLLGGLNLDAYCQAKNSEASAVRYNKWICYGPTFTINFSDACRWTYGPDAYPEAEPGRPLAINCYR